MNDKFISPLLRPEANLDEHSSQLIQRIYKEEMEKALNLPTDDPLDPKRKIRVDYTYEEIQSQPDKVAETLKDERASIQEAGHYLAAKTIDKIYMVGCGDSVASLQGARYFMEEVMGITCEAVQALDFVYYYNKAIDAKTLVILLSSSGATVRTVEAMLIARAKGAQTITLSNTPGSPLMVESTRGLRIHAQRKGWPTQSSTAAMAMVMQLGIDMAYARGYDKAKLEQFQKELDGIPNLMRAITADCDQQVQVIAKKLAQKEMYLFTGGGPCYSSAFFGAAKIKEATPNHAMFIPLEEFHHYNSQKAGDPLVVIAPSGYCTPRAMDTVREGHRLGGTVYVVTTKGENELELESDGAILLPPISEYFSCLCYSIPVQLFGYYVAMEKFRIAEHG